MRHDPADMLLRNVDVSGEEHLQAALAQGKGVLLTSVHQGCWLHVPAVLGLRGYPVTAILGLLQNPRIGHLFQGLAEKYGSFTAYTSDDATYRSGEAFRNNQIVFLAFDNRPRGNRAVSLNLGESLLRIHPGPVVLACRYRPIVLYVSCTYEDCKSKLVIHPAFIPPEDSKEVKTELCDFWATHLLNDIRQHPAQWFCWNWSALEPSGRCAVDEDG
jgi:KDO2-lipid IV(A) lauroyltransferase